jgi:hypothetical protein
MHRRDPDLETRDCCNFAIADNGVCPLKMKQSRPNLV